MSDTIITQTTNERKKQFTALYLGAKMLPTGEESITLGDIIDERGNKIGSYYFVTASKITGLPNDLEYLEEFDFLAELIMDVGGINGFSLKDITFIRKVKTENDSNDKSRS